VIPPARSALTASRFFLRKTGIDSPEIEILPLSSH
jgi:hypothetical protein